ncbi:GntR family transcriptional regulator [Frondihabitans australicus]|uniref:GntR family transcriptional regulator n=1 Tax=Frondihabitans australicus TaxID=386892 RepID=A0A495IIG6_9MICO|nr:GntR family transcriptional regulator [Frondihabitans australicus]RKR75783.1 GntR family transcriptional regulator [Frondihabitans australicus]
MTDTSPYDTLRGAILSLDLVPGERLSERGLESVVSASRTPIRAALLRLEADGLVQRVERGWRVAPIDLTEIRALAEYREAVETAAVRLSATRASDDELLGLRAVALELEVLGDHAALDPLETGVRAGSEFHVVLARLSGNPFLGAAIADVMTRLTRTRYLEVRTPASRAAARDEHAAIVDALLARDGVLAASRVAAHIRGTSARLLDFLGEERRRLRGRGFAIVES